MTVAIWPLDDLGYTPMDTDPVRGERSWPLLRELGVSLAGSPAEAAVYVTRYSRVIGQPPVAGLPRRPLLVWTHETRRSRETMRQVAPPPGTPWTAVAVMNAWNGEVYTLPFIYWRFSRVPELPDPLPPKRSVLVATWRAPGTFQCPIDGTDRDLTASRQAIALAMVNRGAGDVFGRGWPDGLAKPVPGDATTDGGNWRRSGNAKGELLAGYRYVIAMENTLARYYVSEKLWDALAAARLPVYHVRGSGLEHWFPPDSIVDAGRSGSPEILAGTLLGMSDDEYRTRLSRCLETVRVLGTHFRGAKAMAWRSAIDRLVVRLHELAG